MDRLSAIFRCFQPSARAFYSGNNCRRAAFDGEDGVGHIHILRSGRLLLEDGSDRRELIDQPSVLFYPRPQSHAFETCDDSGLALLCASVNLGSPLSNPLVEALPDKIIVPLAKLTGIESLLSVMFAEAFDAHCGRQVALDHLISYFLVLLLRHLIDSDIYQLGLLAGLSDAKLSRALTATHDDPSHPWTLERLADTAGMSRARFADHFRQTVGMTPMEYVARWRMGVSQSLLKQGYSIKQVAPKVGYRSAAALTRVFTQRIGMPPSEWAQGNRGSGEPAAMQIGLQDYMSETGTRAD